MSGEALVNQLDDNYAKGSNSHDLEWTIKNPIMTLPVHITSYSNRYYKISEDEYNKLKDSYNKHDIIVIFQF